MRALSPLSHPPSCPSSRPPSAGRASNGAVGGIREVLLEKFASLQVSLINCQETAIAMAEAHVERQEHSVERLEREVAWLKLENRRLREQAGQPASPQKSRTSFLGDSPELAPPLGSPSHMSG